MDVWRVTEGQKNQCRAETENGSGGHHRRGEERQTAMVWTRFKAVQLPNHTQIEYVRMLSIEHQ